MNLNRRRDTPNYCRVTSVSEEPLSPFEQCVALAWRSTTFNLFSTIKVLSPAVVATPATQRPFFVILNLNVSRKVNERASRFPRYEFTRESALAVGPSNSKGLAPFNPFNPSVIPLRSHQDTVKAGTYFQRARFSTTFFALRIKPTRRKRGEDFSTFKSKGSESATVCKRIL